LSSSIRKERQRGGRDAVLQLGAQHFAALSFLASWLCLKLRNVNSSSARSERMWLSARCQRHRIGRDNDDDDNFLHLGTEQSSPDNRHFSAAGWFNSCLDIDSNDQQ
jgi:hypothetical protein